jgi:glycosyltransferase involved in cell wall biosynthesis
MNSLTKVPPSKPLITILTVVYNDAENLEKTLKSIADQDYKEYEFVLVDGGSTDGTLAVIRHYEHLISKWISEPDNGIYDAMNKGIKMAGGMYINFLNAGDEYCSHETLGEVNAILKEGKDIDILYGKVMNDSNGEQSLKYITGKPINPFGLYMTIPICHQTMFVKLKAFDIVGSYSTDLRITSDYEWLVKYYRKMKNLHKLHFMDKPLILYKHGGFSFQNMRKVALERAEIAKNHFPWPYRYIGFLSIISLIGKSYLIPIILKLRILDVYRHIKYGKALA